MSTHPEAQTEEAKNTTLSPLGEAALRWAGWFSVVPLTPRNKRPPLTEHGVHDATRDPEQIREWWTRWPDANIGVAGGSVSDWLVIIDEDAEGALAQLAAEHGQDEPPPTFTVLTRPGRRQLYYRGPEGTVFPNSVDHAGMKIDIRATGGYGVLPPSIHPDTGQPYQILAGSPDEIAALPAWFASLILTQGDKPIEPADEHTEASALRVYDHMKKGLADCVPGVNNYRNAKFFAALWFGLACVAGGHPTLKAAEIEAELTQLARERKTDGIEATVHSAKERAKAKPIPIVSTLEKKEKVLAEFNRRFCVVEEYGAQTRVIREETDDTFAGRSCLVSQSFDSFRNRYMHRTMQTSADAKPISIAKFWLHHPERRQYLKIVFAPGRQLPSNVWNLWHGFAVQPSATGDCNLYLNHLRENVCAGNAAHYEHLIKLLAYWTRNPGERGHVAVVLQGKKGVGKSIAAENFGALWGRHYLAVNQPGQLVGRFNSHLRDVCVLLADEALFAGNREHESTLKTLITQPCIPIEQKFHDLETVPNLLRIFIAGNPRWLVSASEDERRYFVLEVADTHKQDTTYFAAMQRQMDTGGRERLLHHLLTEVDLADFDQRVAPKTAALAKQQGESLRGVEDAWHDCLYLGELPAEVKGNDPAFLSTAEFLRWANDQRRWEPIKPQHVGALFEKLGFRPVRIDRRSGGRGWWIPVLHEARRRWDEHMFEVRWPEAGDSQTEMWSGRPSRDDWQEGAL